MNDFRSNITQRLREKGLENTLTEMGYPSVSSEDIARLKKLMQNPEYYAKDGKRYDRQHSGQQFLYRLSEVLGISKLDVDDAVHATRQEHLATAAGHRPYIFVETGWSLDKRGGTPLFALAALEQFRRIRVKEGGGRKGLAARLDRVRELIRDHQEQLHTRHGGTLRVWGVPQSYHYYYSPDRALVFSPQGQIIGEYTGKADGASMSIG